MATQAAFEIDYILRPSCNALQVYATHSRRATPVTQMEAIWLNLLSPRLFVMADFAFSPSSPWDGRSGASLKSKK
jgi:hypothetical protein